MKLRRIFFTLAALLLGSFGMRAQSGSGVEVDYNAPKSYILGGVKVEGNTYFSEQQILSLTGLRKGKQITIPGEDVTAVVKRLWQQRRRAAGKCPLRIMYIYSTAEWPFVLPATNAHGLRWTAAVI